MIALWMLYCTAISLLLGVAALAAERALRVWTLPRRWVWATALVGSLVLGTAAWFAPVPSVPVAPAVAFPAVNEATEDTGGARPAEPHNARITGTAAQTYDFDRLLIVAWLALSGIAVGTVGASALKLRHQRRGWKESLVDGTPVFITDALGPGVIGFASPRIVLPQWALSADPETLRLMMAHEKEHVRAGDQYLLISSLIAAALFSWNLALWWLVQRLRHAMELDCDARVLRNGTDVKSYGELLLAVSRRPSPRMVSLAAFADSDFFLERRIRAMVTPRQKHGWVVVTASATLSGLLLLAACEVPRPIAPGGTVETAKPAADLSLADGEVRPVPRTHLATMIRGAIAQRHPSAYADPSPRQAVWFVVDHNWAILESWVGPEFTDQAWLDWVKQSRYAEFDLGPYLFDIPGKSGQNIRVVWAVEGKRSANLKAQEIQYENAARLPDGVFAPGDVDKKPSLTNKAEAAGALQRTYPSALHSAGIEGHARVQFVIDERGNVDRSTIRVLSATHEAFGEAAADVVEVLRFSAGQRQGESVPVMLEMPLVWQPRR